MKIVIHCGGMPFDGNTPLKQSLGGSESMAVIAAEALTRAGNSVQVFSNTTSESVINGVRYVPAGAITERTPLGESFHFYAENTPIDVLIIQRHPAAFKFNWQSKINLWWVHDLPTKEWRDSVQSMMVNVDGVIAVSKFQAEKFAKEYDIDEAFIHVVNNAVDLSIFDDLPSRNNDDNVIEMIYASRPERGLENLVAPGGIMEKLGSGYRLRICNYNHTTERMAGYYRWLYECAGRLDNVEVAGHLNKRELAEQMAKSDLLVYPTAFDETFCITAVEAMASGLPMISSSCGALPEIAGPSHGVKLIDLDRRDSDYRGMELRTAGTVDIDRFVSGIKDMADAVNASHRTAQLEQAKRFGSDVFMSSMSAVINNVFDSAAQNKTSVMKMMIHESNIVPALSIASEIGGDAISESVRQELDECYSFTDSNESMSEYYQAYYEYESSRGVEYGIEDITGDPRFNVVADEISRLPPGSTVIDYGCAHGHYTNTLAKMFVDKNFIGIDITDSNIEIAKSWASDWGLGNVRFYVGDQDSLPDIDVVADAVICAEVLEHVREPHNTLNSVLSLCSDNCRVIVTVPFGPWEAEGYRKQWPWRAHIWHFDRTMLADMMNEFDKFSVVSLPHCHNINGDILGNYVVTADRVNNCSAMPLSVSKIISTQVARETLSVCVIAKDAENDIGRCLASVADVADEVIVAVDRTTTDDTHNIICRFREGTHIPVTEFFIDPVLETGFDVARNKTLERAAGDWILWIDTDEVLHNPQRLRTLLRHNHFNGYSIPQHHFSVEPLGVQKTDYPVRVFRNNRGIRFFGRVHEHPETALNAGVGRVVIVDGVSVLHYGYTDETTRRGRFARNIDLLARDREDYPDRTLGKFLWVRDLAQMTMYDIERTGGRISDDMIGRARRGVELFRGEINEKNVRMIRDFAQFYSLLAEVLGGKQRTASINGIDIDGVFLDEDWSKIVELISKIE